MATAAQLSALRARIARILNSDSCQRISFNVPGFSLRPGAFLVIGTSFAIPHATHHAPSHPGHPAHAAHPMPWHRGQPMHVRVGHMPPGAEAFYLARSNSIVVKNVNYGNSADERMAIVHESTHAIIDYQRVRISALEEEAVAYIAGACYRRLSGETSPSSGAIFNIAESIAENVFMPTRLVPTWNSQDSASPNVTPEQMQLLTGAIRKNRAYAALVHHRLNYRYPHDGGRI